ncbi:MAG: response regulator [Coriobacteriia bacterium]|nr:response regulator [Coriobacteriia bacterium]
MSFFEVNLDYVYFLSGLSFVSLGAVASVLVMERERSLRWIWLAAFGIAIGLTTWAACFALDVGDTTAFQWARFAGSVIAYVALFEFGRSGLADLYSRVPGRWATAAAGVIALGSAVLGLSSADLVVRFAVALPAGLLAGAAVIASGRRLGSDETGIARRADRMLLGTGILLLVYAACLAAFGDGLVNAAREFSPRLGPAPVQGIIAMLVFFAANEVLGFSAARQVLRGEMPGLHRAFSRFYAVAVMLVLVAVGGFAVSQAGMIAETQARATLLQRALTAAASVDAERLGTLRGDASDSGGADFEYVLEELEDMHAVNADIRYMYLMRQVGGKAVFLVDSSAMGADGVSRPGVVYDEASPELTALLANKGEAFVEGPSSDSFGSWVTAFVPIREDGQLLAVLGMDLPVAHWTSGLSSYRATAIALVLVVSVLLLGAMALVQAAQDTRRRVSASERRLRSILASAPDGIAILEPKSGRIEFANPTLAAMLGVTAESLAGLQMDTLVAQQDRRVLHPPEGSGAATSEGHLLKMGGDLVEVEITRVPITIDETERLLIYVHDVSERKAAERTLHERITLENIVRAVSGRFLSADAAGVDTVVNEALATLGAFLDVDHAYLGSVTPEGLAARTHEWCSEGTIPQADLLQALDLNGFPWYYEKLKANEFVSIASLDDLPDEAMADRALMTSLGVRSRIVIPLVEGQLLRGYLGIDTVREERVWTGERIALLTVFADVLSAALRRAKAETELAKLSLAVTNSPAATVITDADGTIEYVNPRFAELSGHDAADLIGANPRVLNSGTMDAEVYAQLWRVISSGGDWQGEITNRRKDGTLYAVAASISPVRDAAGAVHYVGVQEDITALKVAEDALREAADIANSANRAKSDFLATMSHEIRTPMNAIIGMGELLEETELTEEQHRYIRIFRSAGEALLTLINDILDLSKIEAGHFEITERPFDIEQMVEETADVLAIRAREKGIDLLVDLHPETPRWIVGDPDRIRQVLVNLAGNAVKFTAEGHVVIEVGPDPADAESRLRFTVTDTGIGIPTEKLDTIFEAFTQADSSTTRRYGGTGLGLTISRKLTDLMGGQLRVASEMGKGSSFSFAIPMVAAADQVPSDTPVEEWDLTGVRTFVIDDSETNRLILRRYLEHAGATVDEASSATEGLAAMHASPHGHDVMLTDLRMPDQSGFDVAASIAADPALAGTKVIVVSSDARPGDERRAIEAGASALLMKPVRRGALLGAVAAICRPATPDSKPTATAGASAKGAAAPSSDTPDRPIDILLVEDVEDNRLLACAYLKNTPHRVVSVGDGKQAVDAYKAAGAGGFGIVLMDMQMPVMDGYAATREIRQIERAMHWTPTPIVALTAYALAEETAEARKAGCDDYLTKPIKKATLLDAIARHSGE